MARQTARSYRRSVVAGVVVLALGGLITWVALTAYTGSVPFVPQKTVQARFDDVDSLQVGDDVRVHSVRVGRVSVIEYVDGAALVTMKVGTDVELYRDARAALWDVSPLGSKLINLFPGTPAAGPLGEHVIRQRRTAESADLYELLNVFDPRTLQATASSVRELGFGMAGHAKDLQTIVGVAPAVLTDLGKVSSALVSKEAQLPALLDAATQLSSHLAASTDEIAALQAQLDRTLRSLNVGQTEPLQATLDELPGTLDTARSSLVELQQPLKDTEATMRTLHQGAEALGVATPDLRGVLREARSPLRKVPEVAEHAGPAVEDLTHVAADLRPLARPVRRTLAELAPALSVLAPYIPEAVEFVHDMKSVLSPTLAPGEHALALGLSAGPSTALGTAAGAVPNPLAPPGTYPEPGEASKRAKTQVIPRGDNK